MFRLSNSFLNFGEDTVLAEVKSPKGDASTESSDGTFKFRATLDICTLFVERKNLNQTIASLELRRKFIPMLLAAADEITRQCQESSEIANAIAQNNLEREEGMKMVGERNSIAKLIPYEGIGFQSNLYIATSGVKASCTLRRLKESPSGRLYFSLEGTSHNCYDERIDRQTDR